MSGVLAAWPYPWTDPTADALHRTLTQLFPSAKAAGDVGARAGIEVTAIDLQQAPKLVWKDVLEAAAIAGRTRAVVESAHGLVPATSPGRPLLDALLAERPPAVDAEPAIFLAGRNGVDEPEALLFRDSLLLPMGRVPALIATLRRLVTLAPAVCKLEVAGPAGDRLGTGLLIGPDLVLSCWHVLHGARSLNAEFGYEDDEHGHPLQPTVVRGRPETVDGDPTDDWAVVRLKGGPVEGYPVVALDDPGEPELHAPAYLIQHPGGIRKRIGFVRNQVTYVDDRVVQYLTDTQTGSSGAPVLDAEGRVIAIHRAGGTPQEITGRPPIKNNEGIRVSRILSGLGRITG